MKFDTTIFDSVKRIDELDYKDIKNAIVPGDLPHKDYIKYIKYVKFVEMRKDVMKFFVPNHLNGWNSYIQFVDFNEQIKDKSIDANECARLLLWGSNLRIHCTCPSELYWGYQFVQTQLGIAMVPENRFPRIRNPLLKGIACKHLRKIFVVLPWHLGDLAAYIKAERQNL